MACRFASLAHICSAKEPSDPPNTRSPKENLEDGGAEVMVPANSRPRMKGGVTRVRLF